MENTNLNEKINEIIKTYQDCDLVVIEKSKELLNAKDVRTLGFEGKEEVFNEDLQGYLLFIDLMPIANWAHPCRYCFVSENKVLEAEYRSGFPPMDIGMDEICKIDRFTKK